MWREVPIHGGFHCQHQAGGGYLDCLVFGAGSGSCNVISCGGRGSHHERTVQVPQLLASLSGKYGSCPTVTISTGHSMAAAHWVKLL